MPSEGNHVRLPPQSRDSRLKLLQRNFAALLEQLKREKKRADDAEQMLMRLATRLRDIHNERIVAVQTAAKANAELSLYKIQLEMAQRDIIRAQDTVKIVDDQRCKAELSAANARTALRRLNDERIIQLAREEGRNLGIAEGLQRGRAFDLQQANIEAIIASRAQPQQRSTNIDEYDDEYESDGVSSSRSASDTHSSVRSIRPPSQPVATTSAAAVPSIPVSSAPPAPSSAPVPTPAFPLDPPAATSSSQQHQPVFHPITDIHPTIVSNIAPEFHHPHFDVPSDGFIPSLGPDNRVHLPPPHELDSTPQLPSAPSLPPILEEPTPEAVRARQLTSRPPLPERDLTTPLGASHHYQILQSRTSNNTPGISRNPPPPQPPPGHQHGSFAPVQDPPPEQPQRPFVPPPSSRSEPDQDFSFRSPITVRTPSSMHLSTRGSRSSIGITVVSPSESASGSRGVRSPPSQGPASTSVFMTPSMNYDQHPPIISVLSDNQLPPGFIPMSYEPNPSVSSHDAYSAGYMPSFVPSSYTDPIQPVIPDPQLLGHHTDSDDEVHSSSSNNTLTTPPDRNNRTLPGSTLGHEQVSMSRTSPANPAPTNGRASTGTSSPRPETSALRRSTVSSTRVSSPRPTSMMGGASPQPELTALRSSPVVRSEVLPRSRSGSIAGPHSTSALRSSLIMDAGSTSPERRASPAVRHEMSRPSSISSRKDPVTTLSGISPRSEPVNLEASPLAIPGAIPIERPASPAPVLIPPSVVAITVPLPLSRPASMVSPPMRPLSRMGSVTRSPPPETQEPGPEPAVREPSPEPDPGPALASKQAKKKKKKR